LKRSTMYHDLFVGTYSLLTTEPEILIISYSVHLFHASRTLRYNIQSNTRLHVARVAATTMAFVSATLTKTSIVTVCPECFRPPPDRRITTPLLMRNHSINQRRCTISICFRFREPRFPGRRDRSTKQMELWRPHTRSFHHAFPAI
jgi:hypothetical protein